MMSQTPATQSIVCSPASIIPSPKLLMRNPSLTIVLATICVLVIVGRPAAAQPQTKTVDADAVTAYVRSCLKPNSAFGPADQEYTDAAWNYPAVLTLSLMGEGVANPRAVLENGLGAPLGHGGMGHWLFFHQHRLRQLLGAPIKPKHRQVEVFHQGTAVRYYGSPYGLDDVVFKAGGKDLPEVDLTAEKLGYYNLASLYYTLAGLEASGREAATKRPLIDYILRRQAIGGGFSDVRNADGAPRDEDAHIAHTYHAVESLRLLGAEIPNRDKCIAFVHACQDADGSFRFNPAKKQLGNQPDIYYTFAALQTLARLKARPEKVSQCIAWINSLQNADGGFGDKPRWRSRLYSTYYAVQSLGILTGDPRDGVEEKKLAIASYESIPDGKFGIYQSVFKIPLVAPNDLAGLAKRKLNLLALKSTKWTDAEPLLSAIAAEKLPLDVVLCPEMYPHRLRRSGDISLNHVGNFTLDPRWTTEEKARWEAADAIGRNDPLWKDYAARVIRPLRELGSLCYPEQDFEMEFAYSAYDEGVSNKDSYNAILAGFNWPPHDFVRVFPWRERYTDKLTAIADCDAHGDLVKWSPQLDYTRHLYIASGPRYADFQEAAAAGRIVCAIVKPEGVKSGVSLYGPPAAVEYARKHMAEWKWW